MRWAELRVFKLCRLLEKHLFFLVLIQMTRKLNFLLHDLQLKLYL